MAFEPERFLQYLGTQKHPVQSPAAGSDRPLAQPARHPRQRYRQISQQSSGRRNAKDVQSIANLHFLEVAEIGIQLAQGLIFALTLGDAGILIETDIGDEIEDLLAQQTDAARIAARSLIIFVDQRLQILERAIAFSARQRRRQMIDDDGAGAALGLRALAGIIDDEGVEVRQRPRIASG